MVQIVSRRSLLLALTALAGGAALPAQAGLFRSRPLQVDPGFPNIGYSVWSEAEPHYRLYPGDEIEVSVPSAPELSRSLFVQPDGRISLPLIGAVMVADRALPDVEATLAAAYFQQLLRPQVLVSLKTATPLRVFVMGEVVTPGVYDMPGDINALQAIAQAGGLKTSARTREIAIIRRGKGGQAMMRTLDLKAALQKVSASDLVPLRRFDIVYVPRSGIAETGLFVQQYIKDLQPFQLGFSYALNGTTTR